MPDPNTPWYAWSGTVNGNRPGDYVRAWKHVRKVLDEGGAARRSSCSGACTRAASRTTEANALKVYFPGAKQVDLVGADAYNFGNAQGLTWTAPADLFAPAYGTIQKLAKKKPFWISETGSTARGGDEGAWIGALGQLGKTMPKLRRSRLVRRPGQHRRLPRAAQGRGRSRVQGVRSRRVQVMASAAMSVLVEGE